MLEIHGDRQRATLVEDAPFLASEAAEVVIDPPDRVFETEATIEVGGRRVELRYLGRAHTDNDIVIHVPDAGVVFAGDLVEESGPPYFGDGYPIEWPAAVERLIGLEPVVIVPGHGAVGDRSFLDSQLEDLRAIADLGRRVHTGELDLEGSAAMGPYPPEASRDALARAVAQLRGDL